MTPIRLTHVVTAALLLALVGLGAAPVGAAGVYWTRRQLLESFFAKSKRVTYTQRTLTAAQEKGLATELGYPPAARWTIYYGLDAKQRVTGYAVIDEQRGQHEPITFGVLIDPSGQVERVEVMVYREAYGGAVREARFRRQFRGKTVRDPVQQGQDIAAISGATISSRALAIGVKRVLAVVTLLVVRPLTPTAAVKRR